MIWASIRWSENSAICIQLNIWLMWHMDNIDIIFSFYFFTWCICTIISYIYSCVWCIDPGALLETWLWAWRGQVEHKIKCIVWWYTVYIYILTWDVRRVNKHDATTTKAEASLWSGSVWLSRRPAPWWSLKHGQKHKQKCVRVCVGSLNASACC